MSFLRAGLCLAPASVLRCLRLQLVVQWLYLEVDSDRVAPAEKRVTQLWATGNICSYLTFFPNGPKFPLVQPGLLHSQPGALPKACRRTLVSLPAFRPG